MRFQELGGVGVQPRSQHADGPSRQGESGGLSVPAEPHQQVLGRFDGADNVEPRNAPRRCDGVLFLHRQHYGGPLVTLGEPSRDQPGHAAGDGVVGHHQHRGQVLQVLHALTGQAKGVLSGVAALQIQGLQLAGQRPGLLVGIGGQQPVAVHGVPHPPGRVQPGADLERDGLAVHVLGRHPCRRQQRPQAGAAGLHHTADALGHQVAVLVHHRHQVRDCAQGRQFQKPPVPGQPVELVQTLDQLEGQPGPAEVEKRVFAAGQLGIDGGDGRRQPPAGQVVVGDDHVRAPAGSVTHLVVGRDPAVHGYDERDALGDQPVDGLFGQPVTFIDAVGQIGRHRDSHSGEALGDDCRAGDAVHVEVPEHAHTLLAVHRAVQPLQRGVHAGQPQGVVGQSMRRVEEEAKFLRGVDAPAHQDAGHGGRGLLEKRGSVGVGRVDPPRLRGDCRHRLYLASAGLANTRTELCPPNPNELLIATLIAWVRASLGV